MTVNVSEICFLGYGLHPPWSEGTRVLTRDEMRAIDRYSEAEVRGISTYRRGNTLESSLDFQYVRESVVGDYVEASGGYRYNADAPMLARLAWYVAKTLRTEDVDVIHAGFASHSIFSLINDIVGDAAFVAQTFGGVEHAQVLRFLDTSARIDAYVSTTSADIDKLRALGVSNKKLYRLNPPVFIEGFGGASPSEEHSRFGLEENSFVVGYFGNVNEVRFPFRFAKRINELAADNNIEVLVVTKQIEDEDIRELGNLNVVMKNLSDEEKRLAYTVADVWTFPFQFDESEKAPVIDPPLTVLEAMASERPVIVTDTLALSETVKHGHDGYVHEPTDISGMIERVNQLRNDTETRERLGANARETVETRYSPSAVADQLLTIYEEARSRATN